MSVLISVPLRGGGHIVVEADEQLVPAGVVRAARPGEVVKEAGQTLQEGLDQTLVPAAQAVMERVKALKPSHAEVTFGLKLSAEAGIVLSKFGGEASIQIKLAWSEGGD